MRRYSILHPFFMSFYSRALYQDVGRRWRGTNFLYLLLLLTLSWAPSMIKAQRDISRAAGVEGHAFVQQIPPITIKNGKVSTDVPMPHIIKNPDDGSPLAIVDITGEVTSLDTTVAKILLTEDHLIVKRNDRETRSYDLAAVKDSSFDSARAEHWMNVGSKWLIAFLFPFVLVGSYIFRIVQALLYALVGMLFAKSLHADLNYPALLRLPIVAVTPIVVVDTILPFIGLKIPFWGMLGIAIALAYLYFGVQANSEPVSPPSATPTVTPPSTSA